MAPDESFLVFASRRHDPAGGDSGLWISFRNKDGNWLPPHNMGRYMTGDRSDFCPMQSPDGRYLFFSSNRINPEFASTEVSYQALQENHRGPGAAWGTCRVVVCDQVS